MGRVLSLNMPPFDALFRRTSNAHDGNINACKARQRGGRAVFSTTVARRYLRTDSIAGVAGLSK
jgi:hypothetical protein